MLAPLLLACGTILLVISLGLGPSGAALRRFALMLIALPFVAAVLFGSLRDIGGESGSLWNGLSIAIGVLVLMIVAYAVVELRTRLKAAKQDPRVREKRPVDASNREPNLLSLLRDEFRREDDE